MTDHISRERLALGACISLAYIGFMYYLISRNAPFGWDEAVYSVKARSIRFGTDAVTWDDYRAPGLPLLLKTFITSGDATLRVVPAIFGAVGIANTWWLGKKFFGPVAGGIAAAGLALTPTWLSASSQVWPDIPGAVLGLAAITVVIGATDDGDLSWWAVVAAPLTFLATLVRFGAPIAIAVGLIVVVIARWRVFVARPGRTAVLVASVAGAVALVLLLPQTTGAEASPLTAMNSLLDTHDLPISRGFTDYAQQYRGLFGSWGLAIILLGIGLAVSQARRLGDGVSISVSTAIITALVLTTVLHGELRYLSPALPFLWIAAAGGFVTVTRIVPTSSRVFLAGVMVLTMLFGASVYADDSVEWLARWRGLQATATEVGELSMPDECVLLTNRPPVAAWYSGCSVVDYEDDAVSDLLQQDLTAVYLVIVDDGTTPDPDKLDRFLMYSRQPATIHEPISGDYFYRTATYEVSP